MGQKATNTKAKGVISILFDNCITRWDCKPFGTCTPQTWTKEFPLAHLVGHPQPLVGLRNSIPFHQQTSFHSQQYQYVSQVVHPEPFQVCSSSFSHPDL